MSESFQTILDRAHFARIAEREGIPGRPNGHVVCVSKIEHRNYMECCQCGAQSPLQPIIKTQEAFLNEHRYCQRGAE